MLNRRRIVQYSRRSDGESPTYSLEVELIPWAAISRLIVLSGHGGSKSLVSCQAPKDLISQDKAHSLLAVSRQVIPTTAHGREGGLQCIVLAPLLSCMRRTAEVV